METIDARQLDFRQLNEAIRQAGDCCRISGCLGQRFIGAGMSGRRIVIDGIPGNALGAYLNGAEIEVNGSAQDAVGDTMNAGRIIVHGSIGDTAGYAMRGGEIYVEGDAGYRAGIHMKVYRDKMPVLVIGGRAGSFLGEYQAGGLIIVLGLGRGSRPAAGNFPCAGMHGGKVFLRAPRDGLFLPPQVTASAASEADLAEIRPYLERYCALFRREIAQLLEEEFTVVVPDSGNPYRQMYVQN